jgi:hypothetical protein
MRVHNFQGSQNMQVVGQNTNLWYDGAGAEKGEHMNRMAKWNDIKGLALCIWTGGEKRMEGKVTSAENLATTVA